MAKKDTFQAQPPVDHYRKSIGKQDYKKSKADLKETKQRAEAKKSAVHVYKDISVMVVAMVVVVFSVYAVLYMMLSK